MTAVPITVVGITSINKNFLPVIVNSNFRSEYKLAQAILSVEYKSTYYKVEKKHCIIVCEYN